MFKLLLLPGDGIGPEVVREAQKTIHQLNQQFSLNIEMQEGLIGGAAIDKTGSALPEDTLRMAQGSNAIILGAVGGPKWDTISSSERPEKGLLDLRKRLNLFANLRPAVLYPELHSASTLKPECVLGLDLIIIRELTGGLYFGEPRGIQSQEGEKYAFNTMAYHQSEIQRIAKVAFEIAKTRRGKLCSVDKANVLEVSELWRSVVNQVHKDYPRVQLTHMYVDNAAMQLIQNPKQFDVILTENMFGDILSDCAAMLTGSIGMLPSASISGSIDQTCFGLYEPIHGSAPDIAGRDIANPIATLLSVSMMLNYSFKHPKAGDALEGAIAQVLKEGFRTKDIISKNINSNIKEFCVGTQEIGHRIRKVLEFKKVN